MTTVHSAVGATTLTLDAEGHILRWDDAARDLFGRPNLAAVGQPLTALIDPRQRGACGNVVAHLCREAAPGVVQTIEVLAQRADGSSFPIECSLWRSPDDPSRTTRVHVLVRDISGRARVEHDVRQELRELREFSAGQLEELRRTQSRLTDIAETIEEVFWIADAQITSTLYISPGYERVWGRTCQSLYANPRSFLDAIHPDDREHVMRTLRPRDGMPFECEYRIVRPDGRVIWIWDRGYPVRTSEGAVDRYIGVAQDITARKATETALRRQETIDAIGHMTGGLAHDFNNLLGVVIGHLDFVIEALPDDSEAGACARQALDAALRGSHLARRLLALARREPAERRVVDLVEAVDALRPLLQHAAGPDVEFVWCAHARPLVSVDPGDLDGALVNLAINARAAMPAGGRLSVAVEEMAAGPALTELSLPPGGYAVLTVADTGCGMGPEVLSRLGEPFFSTWKNVEGTGLGLAMVHAFVRQSGGALSVRSQPGEGSAFRILLPASPRI